MKTLVVYDSVYGNTERIARAISSALPGAVKVLHVRAAKSEELKSIDLLSFGSPTQGFKPKKSV